MFHVKFEGSASDGARIDAKEDFIDDHSEVEDLRPLMFSRSLSSGSITSTTVDTLEEGKLSFTTGNPTIEVTKGTLHLFKDREMMTSGLTRMDTKGGAMKYTTVLLPPPEGRSHVIAILALPVHMSVKDFCNFVASFKENVKYIRFLREMEKRRTMVLMEII